MARLGRDLAGRVDREGVAQGLDRHRAVHRLLQTRIAPSVTQGGAQIDALSAAEAGLLAAPQLSQGKPQR